MGIISYCSDISKIILKFSEEIEITTDIKRLKEILDKVKQIKNDLGLEKSFIKTSGEEDDYEETMTYIKNVENSLIKKLEENQ